MIDDETGPTTDAAVLPGPGDLRIGDPAPEFTLDGVDGSETLAKSGQPDGVVCRSFSECVQCLW